MERKHFLEFTLLETNRVFCIDIDSVKLIENANSYTILYFNDRPIFIKELYNEVIDRITKSKTYDTTTL